MNDSAAIAIRVLALDQADHPAASLRQQRGHRSHHYGKEGPDHTNDTLAIQQRQTGAQISRSVGSVRPLRTGANTGASSR